MRRAEELMDGAPSVAESYFNISDVYSEQSAWLECENVELKEKEAWPESNNTEFSQRLREQEKLVRILESKLKEKEALEASLHSKLMWLTCKKHRRSQV